MPRFKRLETLNTMNQTGLVPVFYHSDPEVVTKVAKACFDGGARLIEFTNRGDGAFEVFRELEKYCQRELPEMITGVGSIVDEGTATLYINLGANFVVGPVLNEAVATSCNRRKIPYSPGCGSASEISKAEALGCEIVKVFPGGEVGGPSFVKAVLGPCPWSSLMPTGGVDITEESLNAWFSAGIVCAGIGSNMITKELLKEKNYAAITENVAATVKRIEQAKKKAGRLK